MQRYFLAAEPSNDALTLPRDVAHHLATVLRAQPGEQVELVLADHRAYLAEVTTIQPATTVKLVKQLPGNSELPVEVTLLCGLPNNEGKARVDRAKGDGARCDHDCLF